MTCHFNFNIKANIEAYPLDQVNCISRAISLCIASYDIQLSNLFLIIDSFERCYSIKSLEEPKEPYDRELNLVQKYLNLNFEKIFLDKNFFTAIEEQIVLNNPVIVPINLKEIFYSDYYREDDWEHPVVIKGFDSSKKVFYILDYIQLKSDIPMERDFTIEYGVLYVAFQSYFSNIGKTDNEFILVLDKTKVEKSKTFPIYIKEIQENIALGDMENNFLKLAPVKWLNIYKYKEILFSLSLNLLKGLTCQSNNYLIRKNNIINLNKKLFFRLYMNWSRSNQINSELVIEINHVIQLEQILIKELFERLNVLFLEKRDVEMLYIFENNEDNIIQVINNIFQFTFAENKIYNTWLGDDSPKVVFPKASNGKISISLSVVKNLYDADFAGGIFIRDGEDMYYYTLDAKGKLNLDKRGVELSLVHEYIESDCLEFGIEFKNKKCNFLYRKNSVSSYNLFYSLELKEKLIEYGIGCKTYYSAKPLVVEIKKLSNS